MIIPEKEKINVIFSSLFISHYPELYKQLSDIMWTLIPQHFDLTLFISS